jgi:hypothetical protein
VIRGAHSERVIFGRWDWSGMGWGLLGVAEEGEEL